MARSDASEGRQAQAMIDALAADAERDELYRGVERLVVGCSGGGDSIVLLELLHRLAPRFDLDLCVAHLNHGWRGAESDADAALVEETASRLGLEVLVERAEIRPEGSREAAARRARLAFFDAVVERRGADAVALGHTADDQIETILMNLARGAGLRGLGGMSPRARVDGLLLLRPLLGVRRATLRAVGRELGLRWREDSSNDDLSLTRNRVRRRLLPEFEAIHPGAVENAVRAAELLREEEETLDAEAGRVLDEITVAEAYAGGAAVAADALGSLPLPVRRRVVRRAIERVRGDRTGITAAHVTAVDELVTGKGAGAVDLPGVRALFEATTLRFLPLNGRRLARPEHGSGGGSR